MPFAGTTSAQYFRALTILHAAFVAGLVPFTGVALLLRTTNGMTFDAAGLPFVAVALAVAGPTGGAALFQKKRDALRSIEGLPQKLAGYRAALILRWATSQGPAVFSIATFMLTGVYWVLGITAALAGFLIAYRPSPGRAVHHLQPSYEDEARLLDPDAVVTE